MHCLVYLMPALHFGWLFITRTEDFSSFPFAALRHPASCTHAVWSGACDRCHTLQTRPYVHPTHTTNPTNLNKPTLALRGNHRLSLDKVQLFWSQKDALLIPEGGGKTQRQTEVTLLSKKLRARCCYSTDRIHLLAINKSRGSSLSQRRRIRGENGISKSHVHFITKGDLTANQCRKRLYYIMPLSE